MPTEHIVPADLDAEEAVLGSLLIADADIYFYAGLTSPTEAIPQSVIDYHQTNMGKAVKGVLKLLRAEDFYRDRHGWIYNAIRKVKASGAHVHQITVAHELAQQGYLEACGGAAYLSHLIANTPTTAFMEDYAKIVHKMSTLRGQIGKARRMENEAYEGKVHDVKEPPRRDKEGIGF